MLAVERNVWEAWRAHDAKKLADLTARDISFINIFGVYLATRTDAMQDWSGTYCDVKSISLTDAAGTMLSPMVGILTFKARADEISIVTRTCIDLSGNLPGGRQTRSSPRNRYVRWSGYQRPFVLLRIIGN
jgi:hypothetical protein